MKRERMFKVLGILTAVFMCGQAYAGGIALYEFGSPDVGLAAAGYAARAQDASTVFTNPAGMSFLDRSQVMAGLQGVYGCVQFNPDSGTTTSGGDGGNAIGWIPGGNLFIAQKLNNDLSVGLGMLSYFGLSEDYGNSWVGRYYIQEGTLVGMSITPTVSYRLNDKVYVGAGLNAMYGIMENKVAINNVGESRPDGQLSYSDRSWGYGGNFGVLVVPQKETRFGLTYLTAVKLDFSDAPDFNGLGPILEQVLIDRGLTTNDLGMDVTVPQMAMFSFYHDLNDQVALLANVGWQDWSEFGKMDIQINTTNPQSLTVDCNYKDTWHGALGVQYHYTPKFMMTWGIAFDTSAVDNSDRTVSMPMSDTWRFALGSEYELSKDLTLGAAYELMLCGKMPVNQERGPLSGTLSGEYNNANFSIFALNLSWKY